MPGSGFDLLAVLPEAFLFATGLLLMLVGAFHERAASSSMLSLVVLAFLVAALLVVESNRAVRVAFDGHFILDGFALFAKILILLAAAATVLLAPAWLADEGIERFEFPLLALFSTLGMLMMVSANSLIALYMALELHSLPLYVLAAFKRDELRATEAGLKYFVLGALASGLLLYGCSLVYGFTGTLRFDLLSSTFGAAHNMASLPVGALVGLVFLIAGLAFKLAAVPFHMWTPDVYEGAPTPVTAFLTAAPKLAALALMLRILFQPFGAFVGDWQQVIVLISIASMLLGAFAAIGQSNIKRLMAYSSIGHVGYALAGVAPGTVGGVYAVLVYLGIYLTMTIGTFGCILMMRRQGRYVEGIDDLAGLSRARPLMALALAIFMFSLAGIPPLAGFFGKLYVFWAAVDAGLVWLAVLGVLTSVVSAFYYLRIVKLMYFDEASGSFDPLPRPGLGLVVGVTAMVTAGFLLRPGPFLEAADAAARALVGGS